MDEVRLTATVYSRKLKTRLKELEVLRKKELEKYNKDFKVWLNKLHEFSLNGSFREGINKITHKSTQTYRNSGQHWTDLLLKDAPRPPKMPETDKLIAKVRSKIRYIALTDQKSFRILEREAEELFGPPEESDEDE